MSTVPAQAECLNAFDSLTTQRRPSRYCLGLDAIVLVFTCPNCKRIRERPENQNRFACDGCHLTMQIVGPDLFVWRDEKAPA